jgi:menaquinone-9 beta-reductase
VVEIAVIGGGPAGLAVGIAARRKGLRVAVYDHARPPADKACGEGLMPDALAAVGRLGVEVSAGDSFPFQGIRFVDRGASVSAAFPTGTGRGIRRTTLQRILIEHAESLGVELHWATRVDLATLKCDWMIGADGGDSSVRKWAGQDRGMREQCRFAFRRHYRTEPWTEYMEIYCGAGYQLYITPVTTDSVCVVVISRNSKLRLDEAIRGFPELACRLQSGAIIGSDRGAVSASRRLKTVFRGRVALGGDASGSVDAITGEGLCLAFQQAVAVVEAVAAGDLAAYQHNHRKMARVALPITISQRVNHREKSQSMPAVEKVGTRRGTNECTEPFWRASGTRKSYSFRIEWRARWRRRICTEYSEFMAPGMR